MWAARTYLKILDFFFDTVRDRVCTKGERELCVGGGMWMWKDFF